LSLLKTQNLKCMMMELDSKKHTGRKLGKRIPPRFFRVHHKMANSEEDIEN